MPLARAWGAGVPRSYFAGGAGKFTEDAIGRVLLVGEAVTDEQEAAALIADIDKCYENVGHEKLMKAAVLHDFPLAISRLCIRMYRVARTGCWDGVFEEICVRIADIGTWLFECALAFAVGDVDAARRFFGKVTTADSGSGGEPRNFR